MKRQVVVRVSNMKDQKSRTKALKIAVAVPGVDSVALGGDDRNEIVVTGEGVDAVKLASLLRKSVGFADVLSVGDLQLFAADGLSEISNNNAIVVAQGRRQIGWTGGDGYGGRNIGMHNDHYKYNNHNYGYAAYDHRPSNNYPWT